MSTNPTDEIESALQAGPLAILPKNCCQPVPELCYYVLLPETKDALIPAVAAFIAEREAGLRKALAEQMDNTIAHQRRADVALDWNRLAVKQRDELQAKYDEAVNVARMNGTERDTLRALLAERDRELELLREVELVARETRDAMDITLSSDDLDGEWQFENTVPIWHDRLANRLAALDTYRAQADKRGEGEK